MVLVGSYPERARTAPNGELEYLASPDSGSGRPRKLSGGKRWVAKVSTSKCDLVWPYGSILFSAEVIFLVNPMPSSSVHWTV